MTDVDNTAAGPFDDERLRFYLRHRRQLEEWLALGKEVRSATVNIFEGLQPEMTELAESLGTDVECQYVGQGGWPHFWLARTSWPRQNLEPLVAIALECSKEKIDPGSDSAPYVGVRVAGQIDSGIGNRLKDAAAVLQGKYKKSGPSWPLYRQVRPAAGANWWMDIPRWRSELLQPAAEAWHDLEPHVSAALSASAAVPADPDPRLME